MSELIFHAVIAIASLYIIMKGASYAILSISDYAKQTGLSAYIIGFLVVSVGTTLPEMTTAIFSSLMGKGAISAGNIAGSNMLNLTVVLGIGAIVGKKIISKDPLAMKDIVRTLLMSALPFLLGADGALTRSDGIILILAFMTHAGIMIFQEMQRGKVKKTLPLADLVPDMFVFVGALLALLMSARWLVNSVVQIGEILDISPFIMGVFFISIGTTVPELTIQVKSILKGIRDIGIGNTFGAVAINASLVIGIAALIQPIEIAVSRFLITGGLMIGAVILATMIMIRREVTWKHGIAMICYYAAFAVIQIFM